MAADNLYAGIDLDSLYDCSDLAAAVSVEDDFSAGLLDELAANEAEEAAIRYARPQDYADREAADFAAFHRELLQEASGFDPANVISHPALLKRDRSIMLAIGSLTPQDLARLGVTAAIEAKAPGHELENFDFVEDSVTASRQAFECLATAFFLGHYPEGSMSDEVTFVVSGTFAEGGLPVITDIKCQADAGALAA